MILEVVDTITSRNPSNPIYAVLCYNIDDLCRP